MDDWDAPLPEAPPQDPAPVAALPDEWGAWDDAPTLEAEPELAATSAADGTIRLSAEPDADALQRDFLTALVQLGDIAVEASQVERLPAAALQVLLAAGLDLAGRGDRLIAVNPSFAFGLAFEAFGFVEGREAFHVEYR